MGRNSITVGNPILKRYARLPFSLRSCAYILREVVLYQVFQVFQVFQVYHCSGEMLING